MCGRAKSSALTAGILSAVMLLSAPTVARADTSPAPYAPLDRPGPALSVPPAQLRAALSCTNGVANATRPPILLVPGTNLDPQSNFSWNYERALRALHWPYCTVTLPHHSMGDVQVAGEYVVYAIRTMAMRAGRRIDILGYSQGGMLPRWALRFWPDTRALVEDVVGLDPSNHGTLDSQVLCQVQCPPAYWQQASGAHFYAALNSGAETFDGIDYTVVYSHTDEVVVPNFDANGSSSLHTGSGHIKNIAVQDICPTDVSEHLAMGSYDAVGYALAIDAFTHAGPADSARISTAVCSEPFQPGVDSSTFVSDYAGYLAAIGQAAVESPEVGSEPPLACYVYATPPTSCAGAAVRATRQQRAPGQPRQSRVHAAVLPRSGSSPLLAVTALLFLAIAAALRGRSRVHGCRSARVCGDAGHCRSCSAARWAPHS